MAATTAAKVLPADLSGRRALDVGTFDGFWAFELERRGADVVAIEVDRGPGFDLASEVLGSRVRRVTTGVQQLSPEGIGGPVDFAFGGPLLVHLRDPVRALERIYGVLRPGGALALLVPFSLLTTVAFRRRPVARFEPHEKGRGWWYPNLATLWAWPTAAGFVDVRRTGLHRPKAPRATRAWHAAIEARRPEADA